jgi:peptidoglycan hydrolase FlgJ
MAISPASDIILDVAQAADPQKALATTRALASASGRLAPDFAATLNSFPANSSAGESYKAPALFAPRPETPERKAALGLESLLLKNFVDQMLPKDAADVFGSGVAGDVWKSMLSEKIADQIAKSGALKIDDRVFATHSDLLSKAGSARPHSAISRT